MHETVHGSNAAALTASQRRYLTIETIIAAVINAVLSLAFVLLVFGNRKVISAMGVDGLVLDAVPQTLMVTLMSALVPGLLTRKRILAGQVDGVAPSTAGSVVRRAIIAAIATAVLLTAVHLAVLSIGQVAYPFAGVLVAKIVYGAILGASIARWTVRRMLVARVA